MQIVKKIPSISFDHREISMVGGIDYYILLYTNVITIKAAIALP